jgi:8-oxo-dGTP pyrophosphatase MutT (NUDIX family)
VSARPPLEIGVLPYLFESGRTRVVLITSRGKGHWILPKGRPVEGVPNADQALVEAFEEAGIVGRFGPFNPIEVIRGSGGRARSLRLFPMHVRHLAERWPEDVCRRRRVLSPRRAIELVTDRAIGHALEEFVTQLQSLARVG